MANRRKQHDLRGVDNQSPEYWEEVLGRADLGMARGSSTHLVYVGTSRDLEYIEGRVRTDVGEVAPRGEGPA